MNFDDLGEKLRASFSDKHQAREIGLSQSRRAIRLCANAIRAAHRGDREELRKLLSEARACLDAADDALRDHPDIRYAGFFHDAAKEYAEGAITESVIFGDAIPEPEQIGVDPPAYLNGMADAVGEMRRHVLDLMRRGELERAEVVLQTMDEMFYLLTSIDFPDAMTGGLRRTTDAARSIIERTRGDLSTTMIQQGLKAALEANRDN